MPCPVHGPALFERVAGDPQPGPIPVEVLRYWRAKGLEPSFDYRDVWEQEHDFAFTAAKVMRGDVLETMHASLDRAFARGETFEMWQKQLEPTLKSLGWWEPQDVADPQTGNTVKVSPPHRLRTIFDTNMRTARAAGQMDRIQRVKGRRPYLIYEVGPSANHRPEHLAWHGLILPVDHPFWETHAPPNGWGCKCSVRSLTPRQRDRAIDNGVPAPRREPIVVDGVPTGHVVDERIAPKLEAPPIDLVPWENKRTGIVELVPNGIDPGFAHSPGEARRRALDAA